MILGPINTGPVCDCLVRMGRKISLAEVTVFQLMIGLLELGWACILAPKDDLDPTIYSVLKIVAPEWAWAVVLAAVGGAQVTGFFARSKRTSRIALCFSTAIWTFVACLFMLTNSAPTGVVSYGIFALMSAWALARAGNGSVR